jgi:Kef-type K+ transport system membrane component KefB
MSGLVSNFVLGIVAFTIGRNFHRHTFRIFGKQVLWISCLETIGAFLLVTSIFLALGKPVFIAILFGAISSATAPAATVMVIREYKARGPLTNTLLGVVAVDDAWCLILFAISLAISKSLYFHNAESHAAILKVLSNALTGILGAFVLGFILGLLLDWIGKILKNPEEIFTVSLGFILLATGIASYLHLSVLLTCMAMGTALINIRNANEQFFDAIQKIDAPLFLFFFVLAGANLEISSLGKLGIMGLFYLIFRIMGKMSGAFIGGKISNSLPEIQKYLGLGLVPQAGVALGCALVVKSELPDIGGLVFSTIVATTVLYEVFGPLCTRYALQKAGEITK